MKEPQLKITVSPETYHEIVDELAKKGYKLGENVNALTLEKGTIVRPNVDFRLASIRKDAALVASRAFNPSDMGIDFVQFVDQIFQYILTGKKDEASIYAKYPQGNMPTNEWK
jgi:hypothetical protein